MADSDCTNLSLKTNSYAAPQKPLNKKPNNTSPNGTLKKVSSPYIFKCHHCCACGNNSSQIERTKEYSKPKYRPENNTFFIRSCRNAMMMIQPANNPSGKQSIILTSNKNHRPIAIIKTGLSATTFLPSITRFDDIAGLIVLSE